jgi:uncharacterized spore protein YtfJ
MKEAAMDFEQTIAGARDAITVRRVYGEPLERNGVTVIPAAAVGGGAGGGGGEDSESKQRGSGGGFGLGARPVGAYVVDGKSVRWEPATDITRVLLRAQVVVAVMLVLLLLRGRRGGR